MSSRHVLRGGSYGSDTGGLRTTYRCRVMPEFRDRNGGFRIVIRRVRRKP